MPWLRGHYRRRVPDDAAKNAEVEAFQLLEAFTAAAHIERADSPA